MVGQVFLTIDTVLKENEVTLRVDLISTICCKEELCQ